MPPPERLTAEELAELKMLSKKKKKGASRIVKSGKKSEEPTNANKGPEIPSVMRAMFGVGDAPLEHAADRHGGVNSAKRMKPRIKNSIIHDSSKSASSSKNQKAATPDTPPAPPTSAVLIETIMEDFKTIQGGSGSSVWKEEDDESMAEHIAFVAEMGGLSLPKKGSSVEQGSLPGPPAPARRSASPKKMGRSKKGSSKSRDGTMKSMSISNSKDELKEEHNSSKSRSGGANATGADPLSSPLKTRNQRVPTERSAIKKLNMLYKRNSNRAVAARSGVPTAFPDQDSARMQRLAAGLAKIYLLNDDRRRRHRQYFSTSGKSDKGSGGWGLLNYFFKTKN